MILLLFQQRSESVYLHEKESNLHESIVKTQVDNYMLLNANSQYDLGQF